MAQHREVFPDYLKKLREALGKHHIVIDDHAKTQLHAGGDMLMVIDLQVDFAPGGAFGVDEGDHIVPTVNELAKKFAAASASVFFSRDYHPIDHCSFVTQKGMFPPHCVQGTRGSAFVDDILPVMGELLREKKAAIVYKGFSRDCDSFGAFAYPEDAFATPRVQKMVDGKYCSSCWTGAFALFSSNVFNDCNAPPDVLAVLDKKSLTEVQPPAKTNTVYVCGLALDFCVLDTAKNAKKQGYRDVAIVVDATRPAFAGGAPLTDIAQLAKEIHDSGIRVVLAALLLQ